MNSDYLIHLERADEFVRAAECCLNEKLDNASASRAYYAALHAAIAALAFFKNKKVHELVRGRVHETVPSEFDKWLVNREKRFPEHKGILHELQESREKADYRQGVNRSEAAGSVKNARAFVSDVKGAIEGELKIRPGD